MTWDFWPLFFAHFNHPRLLVHPLNFFEIYLQSYSNLKRFPGSMLLPGSDLLEVCSFQESDLQGVCSSRGSDSLGECSSRQWTPWEKHTPGNWLPGSMLLLGIKSNLSNSFAECKFEELDSRGGANSLEVDSLGVCSSQGVWLPGRIILPRCRSPGVHYAPPWESICGGAYSRRVDSWEYAPPGDQTPQEKHTPEIFKKPERIRQ